MKKVILTTTILTALLITSCQSDANTEGESGTTNTIDNKELQDLKAENAALKNELEVKDSVYNYYASYMNEIKANLDQIQGKQKSIFEKQANPEMLDATDPNLIEEIQALGALLADNKQKIASLKSQLKNSDTQLGEFENTILLLSEEVETKNMEIFQLQQELENVDAAFGELFTAYSEQADNLDSVTEELNTAYYAFGTKKELIDNDVITTEGGFIGIGKNKDLADDFNKSYFTEIDITQVGEIPLGFEKVEMITDHPSTSYTLVEEGDMITKLVVKDEESFWSISKYLVLVVK